MRRSNKTSSQANRPLPFRRRIIYAFSIYLLFILLLLGVEGLTRLAFNHVSSLDLFVATRQQKLQVANEKQSVIFEGDPLLLWRLKPNLKQAVWDYTVLSTNPQSYRADYPIGQKPSGTIRVVCLGDSVTFGYRVPAVWPDKPGEYDKDALPFPMLIEQHLRAANPTRKIEVFPMAVPGYSSHQGLAWLRRDINMLQPDLVVASFGWNDVSVSDFPDRETIRTDWSPVLVRWLIDHSQAFAHATQYLRSFNRPNLTNVHPVPRVSESEYVDNFNGIISLCRSHQSPVILLGAPYRDRVTSPPEAERMRQYRADLRATAERNQVPYVEILELTEAAGSVNSGFFEELIHPNNMGHRLIAAEIIKTIGQEKLLNELKVPPFIL